MRHSWTWLIATIFAFMAFGCVTGEKPPVTTPADTGGSEEDTSVTPDPDTNVDPPDDTGGGGNDTGVNDTGGPSDTGGMQDSGSTDTGMQDTGMQDTGPACSNMAEKMCNGTCINTNTSLDHCGDCGQSCPDLPNTSKTCVDGDCTYSCVMGYSDADGDLSDPQNSNGCEKMGQCKPNSETCNMKDDDCNGVVDDPWQAQLGNPCQAGMGVCKVSGTNVCNSSGSGVVCSKQPPTPPESTEKTCDGKDNDCDGTTDEGCDDDGDGICDRGMTYTAQASCKEGPNGGLDCDDSDDEIYPGHPGACDGKDNDCDGNNDDLGEVSSVAKTTTHGLKKKSSWSIAENNPVVVTEAGKGFCGAFFGGGGNKVEFFRLKGDGTMSTHVATLNGGQKPFNLMDAAWSGSDCAILYREDTLTDKNDDLRLVRWDVGTSKLQNVQVMNDLYDLGLRNTRSQWEQLTSLEYIRGRGWVAGYVTNKKVKVKTYRPSFKSGDNAVDTFTVNGSDDIDAGPSIDVGPAPNASADFVVAVKAKFDPGAFTLANWQSRIYSVQGTTSSHRKTAQLKKNAGQFKNLAVTQHSGNTYFSYHDGSSRKRVVRLLSSSYNYSRTGKVASQTQTGYPVRDGLTGAPGIGSWLVEPYQDHPYSFENQGGIGFNFQLQNHTGISGNDEVLSIAVDSASDRIYVLSLVNEKPYKTELNAFTCY